MSSCRKSTKSFTGILFLLCAVFLLHLIIAPLTYKQSNTKSSVSVWSRDASEGQAPFNFFERFFIVVDFTGNEILKDMEINYAINRNLRDLQRLLNRTFYTLVISNLGLGIAIYYMLFLFKKTDQRKPILSTSIGGHAPPMMCHLFKNLKMKMIRKERINEK